MLIHKLEEVARKNRDAYAYIIKNEKITYEEIFKQARELAIKLQNENGPIILYGHKSVYMMVSILACLLAKKCYVPMDSYTPMTRVKKIISIVNPSCVLNCTQKELQIEKVDSTKEVNEFLKDMVYIIFTSGSTGEPKGVPISNTNLSNFVNWISHISPLDTYRNLHVLNTASFQFDLSVADIFYSLCNGHTLVGLSKESIENYEEIFRVIKENQINLIVATPTFIKLCLVNQEFNFKNIPFLKSIYFCGEVLEKNVAKKLLERFPKLKIINAYGPTEATSAVSSIVISKDMEMNEEILPVGDMHDLATEVLVENHEIILKGKSVFNGYLTKEKGGFFKENNINCYKTGDIGYIKDNKLYVKGRMDAQVKYKGYRIELSEIEKNMNQIAGIQESVVVAKKNEEGIVKYLKAFVVLESESNREDMTTYIKKELSNLLPEYMIPKNIQIMERLPVNSNGKIDRKKLGDM